MGNDEYSVWAPVGRPSRDDYDEGCWRAFNIGAHPQQVVRCTVDVLVRRFHLAPNPTAVGVFYDDIDFVSTFRIPVMEDPAGPDRLGIYPNVMNNKAFK